MDLCQLIKGATDMLSTHGNLHVDLELKMEERYKAVGWDLQKRNSTSQELVAVIHGSEKDDFK